MNGLLNSTFHIPHSALGRGQAIVEYTVVLGLIVAAILGMQVYAKRGIQAGLKTAADGLSPFGRAADPTGEKAQVEGMRYESGERRNRAVREAGRVVAKKSAVTITTKRTVTEREQTGGIRTRTTLPGEDRTTIKGALGDDVSSRSEVVVERR